MIKRKLSNRHQVQITDNARTGVQKIVSENENLICPVGIAVDENGQLIVADPYTINPQSRDLFDGGIIKIDPVTGEQTLIARGQGGGVNPCGLAIVPRTPGMNGHK